ncbi:MAG: MFS transporter [Dehalococcoidia bacterium]|nr:MAG: MFS transporter [Dehalococcoidia bacterium]
MTAPTAASSPSAHSHEVRPPSRIFYGWWIVLASAAIFGVSLGLTVFSLGVFFQPFEREFGWTRGEVSGAMSLSFVTGGILAPFVGRLVDRFGPRITITLGALILAVGLLAFSQIGSLTALTIALVIMSAGRIATTNVTVQATLANWFVRKRGLVFALTRIGLSLGALIGVPATAALVTSVGWRAAAAINAAAIVAVIAPLAIGVLRQRPSDLGLRPYGADLPVGRSARPVTAAGATFRQAMGTRSFWAIGSAITFFFIAELSLNLHAVPFLTGRGMDYHTAAQIAGGIPACYLLGGLAVGPLTDRFSSRWLLCGAFLLDALGLAVIWVTGGTLFVWIGILLFGIGSGAILSVHATLIADLFGLTAYGAILGGISTIGTIGVLTGPTTVGVLFDATGSYDAPFALLIASAVIGGVVILLARSPASPASPARTG